jgi:hypothetical protein
LVVITAYYAIRAKEIVEEARRDRKIALKEKRLEKLYTPILNNRELITSLIYLCLTMHWNS